MFSPRLAIDLLLALTLSTALPGQNPADLQGGAVLAWRQNNLPEAERLLRILLQTGSHDASALGFLAAVLDREAKFAEADTYYTRALKIAPDSVSLLNNYGNHCGQQGDEARARKAFLHVLELDPAHRNARLQLAKMAVHGGDGADALRRLAPLDSQDPAIVLLRAESLQLAKRTPEALETIDQLVQGHASDAPVLVAAGMLLAKLGYFDRAEGALSQALARNPTDADTLLALGTAAAQAGHGERAIKILEQAFETRPNDPAILALVGRVYATQGDYPHAIALLSEARKLAPGDESNLVALARALDAVGDLSYAALVYDELVALDPSNESFHLDRALDYASVGKYEKAVEEIQRHIARYPNDAQGYFRLGLVIQRKGSEGALQEFSRALQMDPSLIDARYERGALLREMGRLTESLADLETCAAAEPENVDVLSQLGGILLNLKRTAEAEAVLRKAALIDPDNRGVLLHLGRALMNSGKEAEAQGIFDKLEKMGPPPAKGDQSANAIDMASLAPAQRMAAAITRLQKAVDRRPDDAGIRLQLGNTLSEAGRREEATAVYRGIHSDSAAIQMGQARGLDRSSGPAAALEILEKISSPARDGGFYLYRAGLLQKNGNHEQACATISQNIDVFRRDVSLVLKAAMFEIGCGQYQTARSLAEAAPHSPAYLVANAILLDEKGNHSEANAELHRAESCWPGWGVPYRVEGALWIVRGDRPRATAPLDMAQSLGEDIGVLRACLQSGKSCASLARDTMVAGATDATIPVAPCTTDAPTR